MKILKFKPLFVLILSFALFTGCGDDEEEKVSPFVGNFVISSAKVVAPSFTLYTTSTTMPAIPVPEGTDITPAIQAALLSSVNCSSADKSWVELRKDNSIYMSCEGSNAINAGTWEEVDAKTLKLNMNSTAIPSSPTGFVLTVTDVVQGTTGWTGKTSVPMPKEMFAATLAGYGMTIAATPAVYVVPFSMDFVKK
jgi:hypothetical protein